tara:strand:- start:11746 stop:12297 length:552 start_codon:yes stop_codon:yes gene_type:complete
MLWEKTSLDIPLIKKEILEHRSSKPSDKKNYTSYYDGTVMPLDCNSAVSDCIIEYSNSYLDSIFKEGKYKVDSEHLNIWYNVYQEGVQHNWHDHGRAFMSGTIYIEMNESSAPFKIKSPMHALIKSWAGNNVELQGRFKQELTFRPEVGTIIMWPGWVEHTVPEQKETNEPRISISFNVDIKR